jgi:hypothetical protein
MSASVPPATHAWLISAKQGPSGAVRLVQVQIWLLFVVPASLRFAPLGAAGNPQLMVALGLLLLWSITVLTPSLSTQRRCPPVRMVLAVFWPTVLISYVAMHRVPIAADISSGSDRFIVSLMAFSGLALFVSEGTHTMGDLMRIIRTFVAAAAVMSLVAVSQARFHIDPTEYVGRLPGLSTYGDPMTIFARGGLARPAGTASHPIEFGVVIGLALALAIYVSLYDRAWSAKVRWAVLAVIGLGIPISVSRSAIVVAACVVGAFFLGATNTVRVRALPWLFGFLVVVFVAFPGLLGEFSKLFTAGAADGSIATRLNDYSFVSSAVESSPWVGSGPGSLLPSIRILDNQYLVSLVETGLCGLLALLVLLGATSVLGRGGRKRFTDEGDRFLGQMLAGAGLGIMAAAATFDGLSFPMFTAVVALFLGFAGRYWCIGREQEHRWQSPTCQGPDEFRKAPSAGAAGARVSPEPLRPAAADQSSRRSRVDGAELSPRRWTLIRVKNWV